MVEIAKLARTLDNAAHKARATRQLSENTKYSLDDAYDIQAASIQRRLDRGEKRNGMKMGFTSRAKMVQMGLNDMIWGRLTDKMMVEDGDTISIKNYVHPRVEPEIAFLLKRPLGYPCTAAEALSAVDGVAAAMEIIDSRYKNFKFSLEDVVADNASSSSFVGASGVAGTGLEFTEGSSSSRRREGPQDASGVKIYGSAGRLKASPLFLLTWYKRPG